MKCSSMCPVKLLVIIGGLNWGLVGVAQLLGNGANWNVVNLLLGSWPVVEAIVYVLVGVSALVVGIKCAQKCANGTCSSEGSCGSSSGKCCK